MSNKDIKIFMWQKDMCITYLMIFKKMEDLFVENGCEIVDSPDIADWIVIGSCGSFYQEIDSYYDKIESWTKLNAKMAVYGCLPKVTPERYSKYEPDIDLYIDTKHPESVEKILPSVEVKWSDLPEPDGFRRIDYRQYDPTRRYITIQYGCDSTCTFCPHRIGIGPQVSLPKDEILEQIRLLLKTGGNTIFIEGRDTGSWGTDLEPPETFAELLKSILKVEGNYKLFINQLGANWAIRYQHQLPDILVNSKIANVHIPIQTTSDRLLELMGREKGVKDLKHFLQTLRSKKDCPVIRTDMLIGFPTETEEEFNDTVEFVNEYFDEVACYGFELHPNTKIAEMAHPFYDDDFIKQRVQSAIECFKQNPSMVWHCGGQDPQSMIEREKCKAVLNRK